MSEINPGGTRNDLIETIDDNTDDLETGQTAMQSDITAIKAVTDVIPDSGTLTTIDGNVDSILTDTGTTIPNQITALNNVSSADVTTACTSSLNTYDPPTKTEMDGVHTTTDALITSSHSTTDGKIDVIDAFHDVPSANSTDNVVMSDAIGNKNDLVSVPYAAGNSIMAYLSTGYFHVHGQSFVYPDHSDDIQLTAGAGAWDITGTITQIIPTNALSVADFDLHFINISDISANGQIQIDIYADSGSGDMLIGSTRSVRTAVQSRNAPQRIQIPQQPVNTKISCRLSDNTAGQLTCYVSFEGHYYTIS